MAREGGTYYLFSTGDPAGAIGNGNIQIRTSSNLRNWTYAGTVFADKPAWITAALGTIPNLWAPDISYFDGLWHLYYAGSSFGSNNSVIGLATTPTLDPRSPRYHWTDQGLVFRSTSADNFNAIDPSLVTAADGGKWLVFGSFWSGIKLIALDAATGKPAGMVGPGGEFVFADGGSSDLVYHYYDAFDSGDAWVQVRPLTWVDGWPVTGQALVPVPGQGGPPAS
jgi:arabinan endo-1,5-alpha-L-arabinosidase